MTKTASEFNVFQVMFLFLSLEFLSFDFVSYFDIRYSDFVISISCLS
jgi:hypothetical protein